MEALPEIDSDERVKFCDLHDAVMAVEGIFDDMTEKPDKYICGTMNVPV